MKGPPLEPSKIMETSIVSTEVVDLMATAHEQEVMDFLVSVGIGECKKRKRKLLAMPLHSFQTFKLNSMIGTCCKV